MNALSRLRICAGSSGLSQLTYVISTKIAYAGSIECYAKIINKICNSYSKVL